MEQKEFLLEPPRIFNLRLDEKGILGLGCGVAMARMLDGGKPVLKRLGESVVGSILRYRESCPRGGEVVEEVAF